ncbi:hypothetical protein JCM10212_002409 [Sporobolomyces blumeae]
MSRSSPPPRLTLEIASPPLRSSSFWTNDAPPLVPPPNPAAASRNSLFEQDWSPVLPNVRSRSSSAESRFSSDSPITPGSRRSWMDARDGPAIAKSTTTAPSTTYAGGYLPEKTPIPGRQGVDFSWPITPPSPPTHLTFRPSQAVPPRPLPAVTLPPSPPSPPSSSTFSPRPSLPHLASSAALPPTAGHSDNPLLDTRQAPSLRLSPTSTYLLGEGRHASVYLASFAPRSSATTTTTDQAVRKKRTLCAAKRVFPDTESQLSGLGEAFILSKLTVPHAGLPSPPLATPTREGCEPTTGEPIALRGTKHILKLYGVKDERDGIEAPAPLPSLTRSDSQKSNHSHRHSTGGSLVGSPLRGTTTSHGTAPSLTDDSTAPSSNRSKGPRHSEPSPSRPHSSRLSLLPSLAPPLSSTKRRPSQESTTTRSTLAPSPVISDTPPGLGSLPQEPRIDLILEFCPFGNVLQFARAHPDRMNAKRWFGWAREIAAAVAWSHSRGVLHADLKPQNIMVAADLSTRLCDFGMSLFLPPPTSPASAFPTDPHSLGTPAYSPPEFVRPLPSTFSYPSDVFSLGVTFSTMITGREPYEGVRAIERMLLVGNGSFWDWEERRRLHELEAGEELDRTDSVASSLHGFSLDGRATASSRPASVKSERSAWRRSGRGLAARRSDSSESLRSLALGSGRDVVDLTKSLLVEPSSSSNDLHDVDGVPNFVLPPSPAHSRSNSTTDHASFNFTSTEDSAASSSYVPTRLYPGSSIPIQYFLDGTSIVPLALRDLIRDMTEPIETDRPTARQVLDRLDRLAGELGLA